MAITGELVGLDADTLTTMRTNAIAELNAALTAGQSYSIAGRSHNRASLAQIRATLAEINHALQVAQGTKVTRTYANCSADPE